jgi:predicted RNA-binding Zn-ribbon protein involved in translation (DUF1610 family)
MTSNTQLVSNRKCPLCGRVEITRSQRNGLVDRVLSRLNNYPYRCHNGECGCRFRAFGKR